ncbi:MAG: phospholipid carrier-dependent glycosyltransferase [Chloroflexi bacterium]|nr:phospholipid carrier-dependent glycosyltransferase [Chloroflexota bacterium]
MRTLNRYHALLFMLFCLMVSATLRLPDLSHTPPGVHYDEAANGVLAAEIGLEGKRPLFISSYTGKEVLFFYLAGGLMRLIGDSVSTLRLTAAAIGILTVATTYWLGLELFRDRRIALLAAALLAVSFWHLLFSRLGFRAITQPFLQTLTAAALLHGYRKNDWRWLIAAGVFLGLTAYTYLAARMFPLLLLVALLPLLFNRKKRRLRWLQTALMGLLALAVSLPLLNFFWQRPEAFWVRISQVSTDSEGLPLNISLLKSGGMLFLRGDPYWRFNLPERPLFDWFWGGLLIVGWVILLLQWRKLEEDWQRTGSLLLILAPFIMILPTALATNEIVPSNLRAIGLIPFLFYLPAVGLMTLLDDLQKRFGRPKLTPALFTAAMLLLMAGSLYVEQLYFQDWGATPDVYLETDGDLTAVAPFLDQTDTADKKIYVAALHYKHPTLAFLSEKYGQVKWLPQSQALVFPANGRALYIFPQRSPIPSWAAGYFAEASQLPNQEAPDGSPAFIAYELAQTPTLTITHPLNANFGDSITLLGYDVEPGTAAGTLPLTLYWHITQPQAGDFTPFVHLEDEWGHRWSQVETFAYPAEQWEIGETIVQRINVPIPPGTPPGDYLLQVGLFSGATREQLPQLDGDGRYAGTAVLIPNVPIQASPLPDHLPTASFTLNTEIQPGLRLTGYERGPAELVAGTPYGIALWWLATNPQSPLTTRLTLTQPGVTELTLLETQPVHNSYPFDAWETPQFLIDRQTFTLPSDTPSGNYLLNAQFINEQGEVVETVGLGPLSVTPSNRTFTPPAVKNEMAVTLGNEIELIGYTLNPTPEPGQYSLTLVWQAQQAPTTDYTVFVHLLQPDGRCDPCAWQQDVMPQAGQYPTSRWLAGEVIIDSYQITLPEDTPPGSYPLEIGLYNAENGRRLQVTTPDGVQSDVFFLNPLVIDN